MYQDQEVDLPAIVFDDGVRTGEPEEVAALPERLEDRRPQSCRPLAEEPPDIEVGELLVLE